VKVTRRAGGFIKQFSGPGENDIVCFRFWQAVVASGCPGECAYCFLQTQTPYRRGLYDLKGTLFENLQDIVPEAKKWLAQPKPAGLIIGENQDGLAFERPYKKLLGITPLELLIPLFSSENPHGHTLIVLSKFTTTEFAEALGPSPNVVFSWSLSLPSISRRYEKKVAPLEKRLAHAAQLKDQGWRIRFRLDAMAPVPGWRDDLKRVMDQINNVGPEMLTIGSIRATNVSALQNTAAKNGRDATIFDYLYEKDPSGFKYRVEHEFHVEVFRQVADLLTPETRLGLCKEDVSVWRAVGLKWQGCHCLHNASDEIVYERNEPLRLIQVQRASRRAQPASQLMETVMPTA
jgi:DNA repair photolyase